MTFIVFMFTSCYQTYVEEQESPPYGLIQKDSLVNILVDVEIAEATLRHKQSSGHQIGKLREAYYRTIFLDHNVTRAQYDSSMAWYRKDIKTMDEIYEKVISRLSVKESEVQLK